jgi:hypothetical protein
MRRGPPSYIDARHIKMLAAVFTVVSSCREQPRSHLLTFTTAALLKQSAFLTEKSDTQRLNSLLMITTKSRPTPIQSHRTPIPLMQASLRSRLRPLRSVDSERLSDNIEKILSGATSGDDYPRGMNFGSGSCLFFWRLTSRLTWTASISGFEFELGELSRMLCEDGRGREGIDLSPRKQTLYTPGTRPLHRLMVREMGQFHGLP